jgi:mono/diheme cytochrome c family protein
MKMLLPMAGVFIMTVTAISSRATTASSATPPAVTSTSLATDTTGKELYEENCKKCHGVLGVPPKTMKAKYSKIATFDAAFIASRSDDSVVKILTRGKGEDMKSFKEKLTTDQMKAVAKYVRELGSRAGGSSSQ